MLDNITLNKAELNETLNMLMEQWNIANELQDDKRRRNHLDRLECWIAIVQSKIEAVEAKEQIKEAI